MSSEKFHSDISAWLVSPLLNDFCDHYIYRYCERYRERKQIGIPNRKSEKHHYETNNFQTWNFWKFMAKLIIPAIFCVIRGIPASRDPKICTQNAYFPKLRERKKIIVHQSWFVETTQWFFCWLSANSSQEWPFPSLVAAVLASREIHEHLWR